jgi:hypothetical protein
MLEDHHQHQHRIPVIVCDEYSQRTLSFLRLARRRHLPFFICHAEESAGEVRESMSSTCDKPMSSSDDRSAPQLLVVSAWFETFSRFRSTNRPARPLSALTENSVVPMFNHQEDHS